MAKHYINNKKFESLIQKYTGGDTSVEDELMDMFDLLINNILVGFRFKVEHEDAKQDCFLLVLKTLNNFNRDSGPAFNYFTTIIANNLKLLYVKDRRYEEKIKNYTEKVLGYTPSSL